MGVEVCERKEDRKRREEKKLESGKATGMGPLIALVMVSWLPGMDSDVKFVLSGKAVIHVGEW